PLTPLYFASAQDTLAPQIAAGIVRRRETAPIATTLELVDVIRQSVPAAYCRGKRHPARRTFQAVRIEVNGELERLEQALDLSLDRLSAGGRLAVITFHSLEDKVVKEKFRTWTQGCTCPKDFPVCVCGKRPKGRALKPVLPGGEELERNPRARSAKLRTLVKLDESQG
ncbi:MAG: 16S rRNA (cytosine(1402)-N(4))-methyltransferase RsmH, partial [Clostridiales bacterium]|nr:16S rRNA (cytosine(1402)-N(4))-methyltransferase RsmH [Clostridiales bacterium]